jgi:soluble lytic murein transglycosylase
MRTRQFRFGRIPGIGAVAICALAAGWTAGQRALFVAGHREEPSFISPPLDPGRDSEGPASPHDETRSSEGDLAKPVAKVAPEAGVLSPDFTSQQERDLTGLAEAIAFYKAGDLARGDSAAMTAKDKTVRTALEWIALRSFPRETGFERLQAFMQAHPAWPALDWLKKRSEEALFGDRKSGALIKTFFSGADPETAAGKLALARVLTDDGKTSEAAALVRAVWRPQPPARSEGENGFQYLFEPSRS